MLVKHKCIDCILDETHPADHDLQINQSSTASLTKGEKENKDEVQASNGDYHAQRLFESDKDRALIKRWITDTDCTVSKVASHDFTLIFATRGTFRVLG